MKQLLVAALALVVLANTAAARGRGGKSGHERYDASKDFSKQFDEDVKYDRDHPRDDDGQPAPKKRKSGSHRSRKPKAAPPADEHPVAPESH